MLKLLSKQKNKIPTTSADYADKKKYYQVGDKVPQTGVYLEQDVNGQNVFEIACIKGERFPSPENYQNTYTLLRAAISNNNIKYAI